MTNHHKFRRPTLTKLGISLVELLVVVTIISVLAAIGYPNYITFKRETRRNEAKTKLIEMQSNIQRYLLSTNTTSLTTAKLATLYPTLPITTANGYYSINVAIANPNYTITATSAGTEAQDPLCATITIDNQGNKTAARTLPTPAAVTGCW